MKNSLPINHFFGELEELCIPVDDLLTSTPSPCVLPTTPKEGNTEEEAQGKLLEEFDIVQADNVALSSNVALLEAEFNTVEEEEEDPFDEALIN